MTAAPATARRASTRSVTSASTVSTPPGRSVVRWRATERTRKPRSASWPSDRAPDRPGTDDDVEFRLGHIWLLSNWLMSTVFTSGSMHHEVNDVNIGRSMRSKDRETYHHGDLPRALVAAAVDLARSGGPDAVVLREVARRLQVSPAAMYRHFPDRDALLGEVARIARGDLARRMLDEVARVRCRPTRARGRSWRSRRSGAGTSGLRRTNRTCSPRPFCRSCHPPRPSRTRAPGTSSPAPSTTWRRPARCPRAPRRSRDHRLVCRPWLRGPAGESRVRDLRRVRPGPGGPPRRDRAIPRAGATARPPSSGWLNVRARGSQIAMARPRGSGTAADRTAGSPPWSPPRSRRSRRRPRR